MGKGFLLLIFLILAGTGIFVLSQKGTNPESKSRPISIFPTPTPQDLITQVRSPDGTMILTMKKDYKKSGEVAYSFIVTGKTNDEPKTIFTKTLQSTDAMSLSPNAWAPDHAYVFIEETSSNSTSILVFKASGEAFGENQMYIEITPLLTKEKTGHNLRDVTGWDAPLLLHVRTTKDDGSKGPNYWFDLSSQSFLALAH